MQSFGVILELRERRIEKFCVVLSLAPVETRLRMSTFLLYKAALGKWGL